MSSSGPKIVGARQILAHVPDLVLSGSKPSREADADPETAARIASALRHHEQAVSYLPNQIFIGAARPQPLLDPARPWWNDPRPPRTHGSAGVILDQGSFLAAMEAVDSVGLLALDEAHTAVGDPFRELVSSLQGGRAERPSSHAVPISGSTGPLGSVAWGHPGDEALAPSVVLENLATKASAALALADCIRDAGIDPESIDFVISCSEEAIGDRYQRGGGNMGKAVAEAVGAGRASGFDVKNFCAAPLPALVVAASLVESGVADTVAVTAGGSVPKLGMKFQGHLAHDMPVLEDCLGAVATIVSRRSEGPSLRLDAVGRHSVAAGGSNQAIFRELVVDPLERVGLKATDIGLLGTEMHNPELTEPQGSGDVPLRNYRMIAALAAAAQHIHRDGIEEFLSTRAVSGFAPTQGHIASAICLLPEALRRLGDRSVDRVQLVAKGSLFLGKMSGLSDGMSIVIEG